ncbi:hypothetical protein C8R47DRAFT_392285 [Mycena vitilis]|nr:hypothetical protein C8R47DRAFT_392285 [Mycena vitilis]
MGSVKLECDKKVPCGSCGMHLFRQVFPCITMSTLSSARMWQTVGFARSTGHNTKTQQFHDGSCSRTQHYYHRDGRAYEGARTSPSDCPWTCVGHAKIHRHCIVNSPAHPDRAFVHNYSKGQGSWLIQRQRLRMPSMYLNPPLGCMQRSITLMPFDQLYPRVCCLCAYILIIHRSPLHVILPQFDGASGSIPVHGHNGIVSLVI